MASYKTETAEKIFKGVTGKLHSNSAINSAYEFVGQGAANAYRMGKESLSSGDIVGTAKNIFADGVNEAGKANWNYGRIAGSYVAASGAARIATGGGVYRDGQGNNDIIGIPGI